MPENSVKILQHCKITPSLNSPAPLSAPLSDFSLSLTFADTFWIKFPPVERLFFYSFPRADLASPDIVVEKLKHSLSLSLWYFFPLAGNIIWPEESPKPTIRYKPGDAVSLSIAETSADFDRLSSRHVRQAKESRPLLPDLPSTDTAVPAMALQITLFSNSGFSVGISTHHAVVDGKSSIMFMKAWAYLCKLLPFQKIDDYPDLSPELMPFFNRAMIKDPNGLDMVYLKSWREMAGHGLKYIPNFCVPANSVRATFELTRTDMEKLRKRVLNLFEKSEDLKLKRSEKLHLSSFVLTYAFAVICFIKAAGKKGMKKVRIGFIADYRSRLDPPVPANYFGNCGGSHYATAEPGEMTAENGLAVIAEKIGGVITGLENNFLEGAEKRLEFDIAAEESAWMGVAGSPQFRVYDIDFGWGRPKMVEVASLDKTGSMSMAESGDGNGGVEVGFVLLGDQMEVLKSLFVDGLKAL